MRYRTSLSDLMADIDASYGITVYSNFVSYLCFILYTLTAILLSL